MSRYSENEMVTLQDISVRLMKPAKDLADWKFPLSQILEEYYALLEEPCSINFGEAALVLQNSANVYVRRVECLFTETEVLKQAFFGYEEEELRKAASKEKKCSKKAYLNLDNFTIIDLEKEVGKNVDKKERCQSQKRIKLLSRRFTQLENSMTQLRVPICVYDIFGEIIGKKYDFRCNQSINVNGMLVDELTPDDFTRVEEEGNLLSTSLEQETFAAGTSGYQSDVSVHKSVTNIDDKSDQEHDSTEQTITVMDSFEEEPENNNTIESITNIENTLTEIVEESNQNDETLLSNKKNLPSIEINNRKSNSAKEKLEKLNELNGSLEHGDQLQSTQKERNQKSRTSVSTVNDIIDDKWKLMPLNRGQKIIQSDNSSPLKLPNYLSLLKNKVKSRKRKLRSKVPKPESLTKYILRETELIKEDNPCDVVDSRFKHLKRCELESFAKSFDDCFTGTEKEDVHGRYKAVTGMAMDLLGFRLCENENDSYFLNEDNVAEETSKSPIPSMDTEERDFRKSRLSSIRTLKSPDSACEDCFEGDISYSMPDYRMLIEDRMKKIFDESDVATELETTVAKWHASLQPKLSEAELRPAFRIHDYASHIIGTLQEMGQKRVNFDNVVQGKPACEVARYFLASLELANTYNLEINTENCGNSMEITLLDKGRD